MEVSGKELKYILIEFLKYSGQIHNFHGTHNQNVCDFIQDRYPALWNENLRMYNEEFLNDLR